MTAGHDSINDIELRVCEQRLVQSGHRAVRVFRSVRIYCPWMYVFFCLRSFHV